MAVTPREIASMLATAQALDAHPDCPPLPDTYVHHKGEVVYSCAGCERTNLEPDDDCCDPDCIVKSWPDMVCLPDLRADVNGGILYGLLRASGVPHILGWVPPHPGHSNGGYHITGLGTKHHAQYLPHAAGMAWLALQTPKETR